MALVARNAMSGVASACSARETTSSNRGSRTENGILDPPERRWVGVQEVQIAGAAHLTRDLHRVRDQGEDCPVHGFSVLADQEEIQRGPAGGIPNQQDRRDSTCD